VVRFSQDRITSGKETAPDGTPWIPLGKSTVRRKKAKGFGDKKILMQTESMYQNIRLGNVSRESFDVGSSTAYARIHQFGGKTGRDYKATIPARPYIGISEEERQKLEVRVAGWLKEKLEAAK